MSSETKQVFKTQLRNKRVMQRNRKIKAKKPAAWVIPTAFSRQINKIIKKVVTGYIQITKGIFPLLSKWQKEFQQIRDDFEEEIEDIDENRYQDLFAEQKTNIKNGMLATAVLISAFNKKQWQKVTKQGIGVDPIIFEKWEDKFLKTWVRRNVSLIKGLTDDYRKKILDTITDGFQKGNSIDAIKRNLIKINKEFANGKPTTIFQLKDGRRIVYKNEDIRKSKLIQEKILQWKKRDQIELQTRGHTQSRAEFIAKDQMAKLNSQLTQQRQKDIGIDTYIWRTAQDDRVRTSHDVMNGKLCRWDNSTVYSDDNGKTWKSRAAIGGVELHPGEDYNCRCFPEPNFEPLADEINREE